MSGGHYPKGSFIVVPKGAHRDPEMNAPALRVLMELATYASGPNSPVFPSIDTLAKQLGLSPRWVRRALKRAEKCGYLIGETRMRSKGGGKTTNAYRLIFAPRNPPTDAGEPSKATGPERPYRSGGRPGLRGPEGEGLRGPEGEGLRGPVIEGDLSEGDSTEGNSAESRARANKRPTVPRPTKVTAQDFSPGVNGHVRPPMGKILPADWRPSDEIKAEIRSKPSLAWITPAIAERRFIAFQAHYSATPTRMAFDRAWISWLAATRKSDFRDELQDSAPKSFN